MKTRKSDIRPQASGLAQHRNAPRRARSTMLRWERITRIHARLHAGAYPNSTGLARELNLTIRTIHRDVTFMREHLGLPVAFDQQRLGYYYAQPTGATLSQPLSETDVFALFVGYPLIVQYEGTALEPSARSLCARFLQQLDTNPCMSIDVLDALMLRGQTQADPAVLADFEALQRRLNTSSSAASHQVSGLKFQASESALVQQSLNA